MAPPSSTDLPQTSFAVLGMLSFYPMSGYDLKQFADRSIGHFYWSPAKSQVYAELRRLKSAGLVTERHVEQEGRPDKRVYAISAAGRKRLSDWVENTEFEQDVFKSSLMLRLFFGEVADPASLIHLLEENLAFEKETLAELEAMEERCLTSDEKTTFTLLTIQGGIHFKKASIKWSEESIETLKAEISARRSGRENED